MSLPSPLKGESLKIMLIVLLGWTALSIADANTKFLTENDYAPSLIMSFIGGFNLILISLWILYKRGLRGFITPQWKWFIIYGLTVGFTNIGIVNALALIPIADVYGIAFSAPFITVILALILLKEHVKLHQWIAVIAGFIGVLILTGPQYEELNTGLFYTIFGTINIAFSTLIVRKVGKEAYMPLLILCAYAGILAVNLPIALPHLTIPHASDLHFFFGGALLSIIGVSSVTYAVTHAQSAASVAPFVYTQAIFAVILGYILFSDVPTPATIIGLIVTIGAGLYMVYHEKKLNSN